MLKALELVGFKSFADRTRFEFPPGITCVVGPNGSGKSNVVDAVKWVLGEQSVKSLRGKEMADCIFNGSATRAPMNAAEATLVFDNSTKRLPVDTPEVAVTRRVYRNGEGEYLINKQPCRLRDLRELFFGTGAATEAYSVIEQGKVDVLLQSSPKERRSVFEEAAGISRFKARKIESLRRLERVDQNLLRLHDIVEEVENRLKSVRNQAQKARRYQEYVDRLQQLRTQSARADWVRLSERLAAHESALRQRLDLRDELSRGIDEGEARLLDIDVRSGDAVEALRRAEAGASQLRQRMAAAESELRVERDRCAELEAEVVTRRKQLVTLSTRAGDQETQSAATAAALSDAEHLHARLLAARQAAEEARLRDEQAATRIAADYESARRRTRDLQQTVGTVDNDLAVLQVRAADLEQRRAQRAEQRALLAEQIAAVEREVADRARLAEAAERRLTEAAAACERTRAEAAEARKRAESAERCVHEHQRRQATLVERAQLLSDLERRREGLAAAVKQVLAIRDTAEDGLFEAVVGMAADLIRSPLDVAHAVDVVLGARAQYLVVRAGVDVEALAAHAAERLGGRIGFALTRSSGASDRGADGPSPAGRPGVVGRLDHLVDVDFEHRSLCRRLLGATWLVESLTLARRLSEEFPTIDFVTRQGELLTADGELVVGRRAAGVGLVSRRAELQSLDAEQVAVQRQIASAADEVTVAGRDLAERETALRLLEAAERQEVQRAADERSRLRTADQQRTTLEAQSATWERDEAETGREAEEIAARRSLAEARRDEVRRSLADAETDVAALQTRRAEAEALRREREEQWAAVRIDAAKSDERLSHLRAQKVRQERDGAERRRAIDLTRSELRDHERRIRHAEVQILHAEQQIAAARWSAQGTEVEVAAGLTRQEALRVERHELATRLQKRRNELRALTEELHQSELAVETTRLERENLARRIRDDYGVDLAELSAAPATDEEAQQREEVERQIADLRRKINNIGNVNLDALAELDELEARYTALSSQFNDLTSAKSSLEGIIAKIDADSRRLFQETLDVVRGHFQVLFRKLFGGGQGDIVLEPNVDILDAGIEIMARPPGKETRNISLLSGGEKTLTCVALLLAVFQYRPSPFCVLDEVDAALDEANIGRFVGVLHEFLAWTQFIIVTHSKKTMTCASTLYGVTMQESGVSKRVAVRFEDVRDDGEIVERSRTGESAPADGSADTDAA